MLACCIEPATARATSRRAPASRLSGRTARRSALFRFVDAQENRNAVVGGVALRHAWRAIPAPLWRGDDAGLALQPPNPVVEQYADPSTRRCPAVPQHDGGPGAAVVCLVCSGSGHAPDAVDRR
ncbi:hypothetical protein XAP6164_590017 [Xanthomonas phaseoli pv. phaseoli]|nr:hypothetical protein XAP6164_590017 [Xanthomonas phaseoli pv. phaseoli]